MILWNMYIYDRISTSCVHVNGVEFPDGRQICDPTSDIDYNMPMIADKNLEKITSLIRNIVEPEKVVLFGSRANGQFRVDSDYDICIVLKDDQYPHEVVKKIYRAIYRSGIHEPIDVIAVVSDKFKEHSHDEGYIYKDIAQNGITIYGQ